MPQSHTSLISGTINPEFGGQGGNPAATVEMTSCTLVDAISGAVPLVWLRQASWMKNTVRSGLLFVTLIALNLVRLWVVFGPHLSGWPWQPVHDTIA